MDLEYLNFQEQECQQEQKQNEKKEQKKLDLEISELIKQVTMPIQIFNDVNKTTKKNDSNKPNVTNEKPNHEFVAFGSQCGNKEYFCNKYGCCKCS
jgi:hypothetical protein